MESHLVNAQIQEIKSTLARVITTQSICEPERIMFSQPVIFMIHENPDMIFNVYGINKGILLFDTPRAGIEIVDIAILPIETLIKVKEQMEYYYKNKEYSKS